MNDFLREVFPGIPKTETHLHLEGALPWELFRDLDPVRYRDFPDSWAADFRFRDFAHFESELLDMAGAWFTSPERYHQAAGLLFRNLLEQSGVRYLETSFASGVMEHTGLPAEEVCEAIAAAVPDGMTVRIFMGIHHDGYTARSRTFLDQCLGWPALDGLDLHGTETTPLEDWTAGLWKEARSEGKMTKAHAGEFMGPDFIRRVIDELGVTRIEHGVRAIEDPSLVEMLAAQDITLDVCPVSNVKLGVVPSARRHPLAQLHRAGVFCTVNTDDPLSFGNQLVDDYSLVLNDLEMTLTEIRELILNGWRIARISEEERRRQMKEVRRIFADVD